MQPLHVRVAKALGWTDLRPARRFSDEEYVPHPGGKTPEAWYGHHEGDRGDEILVPHFDTDWSATGPLIDKWRFHGDVRFDPLCHEPNWCAFHIPAGDDDIIEAADQPTLLLAVCHLILALKAVDKL